MIILFTFSHGNEMRSTNGNVPARLLTLFTLRSLKKTNGSPKPFGCHYLPIIDHHRVKHSHPKRLKEPLRFITK